jgi:ribosomal protein S18 acetylase RimI-like enzyme
MSEHFDRTQLNARIAAYLRANLASMADHERIGPFLAGFDGESDNPFRNYAVPDDDASPTANDIASLIESFARRKRRPRLEYITATAPRVEEILLQSGFEIEKRFPILVCTPDMLRDAEAAGVRVELAQGDADIVGAAEAGAEAYGEANAYPESLRRLVAQGGILAIARADGVIAGQGMATPGHEGVCEVAGIGVRERYRGRGIAGAMTALATREAFSRGLKIAWLTPGSDGAERIYAQAGYVRASEQLHISKPD